MTLRTAFRAALAIVAVSAALAACGVLAACGEGPASPDVAAEAPVRPRVLAFYYPWWGRADGPSGRWYHWNPETARHDAAHTPVLGLYDSRDTAIVRQHIRWAKDAGIDGFIASWWGPASFEDRSLEVLLAVAEQEHFAVAAMIEHPFTAEELRADFRTLLETRATSPVWLRVAGRPVVFVYTRIMARFGPDDFRRAFAATGAFTLADTQDPVQAAPFDGTFAYGPVQDVDGYIGEEATLAAAEHAAGRMFAAAAVPGYDDRVIRQPGRLLARDDGALYGRMWAAAAGADWVTVTSWNEWHEGTEVEPSLEYGARFLELTRTFADRWRAERAGRGSAVAARRPASQLQRGR